MYNEQTYGDIVSTPNKLWYEDEASHAKRQEYLKQRREDNITRHIASKQKRKEAAKMRFSSDFIKTVNSTFDQLKNLRATRDAHLEGMKNRLTKEKASEIRMKKRLNIMKEILINKEETLVKNLMYMYEPYKRKGLKIHEIDELKFYYGIDYNELEGEVI